MPTPCAGPLVAPESSRSQDQGPTLLLRGRHRSRPPCALLPKRPARTLRAPERHRSATVAAGRQNDRPAGQRRHRWFQAAGARPRSETIEDSFLGPPADEAGVGSPGPVGVRAASSAWPLGPRRRRTAPRRPRAGPTPILKRTSRPRERPLKQRLRSCGSRPTRTRTSFRSGGTTCSVRGTSTSPRFARTSIPGELSTTRIELRSSPRSERTMRRSRLSSRTPRSRRQSTQCSALSSQGPRPTRRRPPDRRPSSHQIGPVGSKSQAPIGVYWPNQASLNSFRQRGEQADISRRAARGFARPGAGACAW